MRALLRLLVLSIALAPAARAEPAGDAARAHALSDEGLAHFRQKRYAEAIAAFEASYALSPLPTLLFDIAQAHRLAGHCADALERYRRYAALAAAPRAAGLDEHIREMETCVESQARTATPPQSLREAPANAATPPSLREAPTNAPPPPSLQEAPARAGRATSAPASSARLAPGRARALRLGGWVALAAGVAALGVAIYFTVDGSSAQQTLAEQLARDGQWRDVEQQTDARGRRDNVAGAALWGVGGAAAVAGAVLQVVGRASERTPRLAVAAQPGAAMITCSGRF
jgi:hypothetical protein